MLEYESTFLSPTYKEKAVKFEEFNYINVYILSKEDIFVSKIIRFAEKDIEDLNQLISNCNKTLLNKIIEKILNRKDLFENKKEGFIKTLTHLKRNIMFFQYINSRNKKIDKFIFKTCILVLNIKG